MWEEKSCNAVSILMIVHYNFIDFEVHVMYTNIQSYIKKFTPMVSFCLSDNGVKCCFEACNVRSF